MTKTLFILIVVLSIVGCTSVTVTPLDASYNVKRICIRENPKVTVTNLVPVITDGLTRHNIESVFITSNLDKEKLRDEDEDEFPDHYYMTITPTASSCEFSLAYTARRSWDLGTYLSTADIEISNKTGVIAIANYHLRNKGGLSLFKWQGVKTKIDPVLDELLKFYNTMGNAKADLNGTTSKVLLNDRASANQRVEEKGVLTRKDPVKPDLSGTTAVTPYPNTPDSTLPDVKPDLSAATDGEQQAIEHACDTAREAMARQFYYECLSHELAKLGYR